MEPSAFCVRSLTADHLHIHRLVVYLATLAQFLTLAIARSDGCGAVLETIGHVELLTPNLRPSNLEETLLNLQNLQGYSLEAVEQTALLSDRRVSA